MKISNFEDLEVWKESRKLASQIYKLTSKSLFSKDFGLKDQIQRAAVSCMLNAAEGFDSDTKGQFVQLLSYSKRSSSEVQSILYVALDNRYITDEEFSSVYEQAKLVRKLCSGLIKYLRSVNDKSLLQLNRLTG